MTSTCLAKVRASSVKGTRYKTRHKVQYKAQGTRYNTRHEVQYKAQGTIQGTRYNTRHKVQYKARGTIKFTSEGSNLEHVPHYCCVT